MAKITLGRIFEISRYVSTDAGKQLQDALSFLSTFVELVIRNLRNGLTFADNMDCEVKTVSLRDGSEEIILVTGLKRPIQVMVKRVIDDVYYTWDKFGWRYTKSGQIAVMIGFPDDVPDISLPVELIIFY